MRFALMMAPTLSFTAKLFKPMVSLLAYSSFFVGRRQKLRDASLSINDLSVALDLTSSEIKDDKDLLKGLSVLATPAPAPSCVRGWTSPPLT